MSELSKIDASERFLTIWEHVECGITIIDAETRKIIDINPVAARMFGRNKEDIVGNVCHKFICPANQDGCPIMDKGQVVDRSERVFIRSDGKTIPIIKSVAKIKYNGRLALLESFTDISKLKETEAQLRVLQVAEEANQAKSDFLSRMSHELRTPLAAIIGMTKLADGTENVPKLKHCLETISDSAQHMLGLINDVLDMSKIEAGKLDLISEPVDLRVMIPRMIALVQENAKKKGVVIESSLDNKIFGEYLGDELRLSQVLANLLSNAVKFTPAGGRIDVDAREISGDGNNRVVEISVSDTGIGMTQEQTKRLFNPFEQADGSISRQYGGTGLGLAISKNIIEKMNGEIWAESRHGQGSRFIIRVPLEKHERQERSLCLSGSGKAEAEEKVDFSGVTVLLAEDVEVNREIFKGLLEDTGLNIVEAKNGAEAVSIYSADPKGFDLIIMDVQMPVMDGYEATKTIRKLELSGDRTIPILAMTANVFNEDVRRCLDAGMNDHLAKPIDEQEVIKAINKHRRQA